MRNRHFDAVVGIGAKSPWHDAKDISGKVTWVGVGPFRIKLPTYRGDLITFEKFVLLDGHGPDFEMIAPIWQSDSIKTMRGQSSNHTAA